jgi:hypothetical protein
VTKPKSRSPFCLAWCQHFACLCKGTKFPLATSDFSLQPIEGQPKHLAKVNFLLAIFGPKTIHAGRHNSKVTLCKAKCCTKVGRVPVLSLLQITTMHVECRRRRPNRLVSPKICSLYFFFLGQNCLFYSFKKGSPVHVAPACAGSRKRSDHFESYVRSLSEHFCKRLFSGLEPMTSWSQGNRFTTVPGLPFPLLLFMFPNYIQVHSMFLPQ